MFSIVFPKIVAFYEIAWKNAVDTDGPQIRNVIRHMRFVYRINKATDTLRVCNNYCFPHSKNVYANAPQMSRYTYTACLGYRLNT